MMAEILKQIEQITYDPMLSDGQKVAKIQRIVREALGRTP